MDGSWGGESSKAVSDASTTSHGSRSETFFNTRTLTVHIGASKAEILKIKDADQSDTSKGDQRSSFIFGHQRAGRFDARHPTVLDLPLRTQ